VPKTSKVHIVLKKGQFDPLKKADVRKLAQPRTTLKQEGRQKGGFVTALLVPAITELGSVLAKQLFPQQQ